MIKNDEVEDETWAKRMEMADCTDDLASMSYWSYRYFGSYERLPAALQVEPQMEFRTWLSLLGEIWCDCHDIGIHKDSLLHVFNKRLPRPWGTVSELMDAEERLAFQALPDQITIYRGCGPHNKHGLSWSLSREVAAGFPFNYRYRTDPAILLTATINKNIAAALKLGRDEQEIVILDTSAICWTEGPLKDPLAN
jgi:hypothetical protein